MSNMSNMSKTIQINIQILKKCRDQMGLSQADVKKKVAKIVEIENADKDPTPNQLTTLAELYQVPRWVFIDNKLPLEYQYEKTLTFRRFKKSTTFNLPKLRQLVSRIEQYRSLFLELREDMDEAHPTIYPCRHFRFSRANSKGCQKMVKPECPA